MELRLTLRMDNQAFEEEPGPEVARILVELADRIGTSTMIAPGWVAHLFDVNGNRVGKAEVALSVRAGGARWEPWQEEVR